LVQQAFDSASTINRAGCDAVLLALDYQDLPLAMAQAADGADPVEASLTFCAGCGTICGVMAGQRSLFRHWSSRW
jgi:hypothetical protein